MAVTLSVLGSDPLTRTDARKLIEALPIAPADIFVGPRREKVAQHRPRLMELTSTDDLYASLNVADVYCGDLHICLLARPGPSARYVFNTFTSELGNAGFLNWVELAYATVTRDWEPYDSSVFKTLARVLISEGQAESKQMILTTGHRHHKLVSRNNVLDAWAQLTSGGA